ncbi:MAG: DUF2950 family protein [Planctomycetota bacterium]
MRASGFTIAELTFVSSLIGIVVAIAVPKVIASRVGSNESEAVETLKKLVEAQARVKSSCLIDADGNGVGEYGSFKELSGTSGIRKDTNGDGITDGPGESRISPPVLEESFGELDERGMLVHSGYVFRLFLPDKVLRWQGEAALEKGGIHSASAEKYWACYAWPVSSGFSGKRVFFVNQEGIILTCTNEKNHYSGMSSAPRYRAALSRQGLRKGMNSSIAVDATGRLGDHWSRVQ